jgi:hypothetical protein
VSTTAAESVWLDWVSLYLEALDDELTVEERGRLAAALEQGSDGLRFPTTLPPDLAAKTERLVAFVTRDEAPQDTLLRAATTHLRHGAHRSTAA